jgi:hypothetical protein
MIDPLRAAAENAAFAIGVVEFGTEWAIPPLMNRKSSAAIKIPFWGPISENRCTELEFVSIVTTLRFELSNSVSEKRCIPNPRIGKFRLLGSAAYSGAGRDVFRAVFMFIVGP